MIINANVHLQKSCFRAGLVFDINPLLSLWSILPSAKLFNFCQKIHSSNVSSIIQVIYYSPALFFPLR